MEDKNNWSDQLPMDAEQPDEGLPLEELDREEQPDFTEGFFSEESEPTEIPEQMPPMEPDWDIDAPGTEEEPLPESEEQAPAEPAEEFVMDPEDTALFDTLGDTQQFTHAGEPEQDDSLSLDAILADFSGESDEEPEAGDTFTQEPAVDEKFLGTDEEKQEFDDMFAAQPQDEEPPPKKHTPRTVRKGRPKRKKGDGLLGIPHLLVTLVWLAIIVAIGTSLGKLLWVGAADVLAFGRVSKPVTVTIVDTDDLDLIAAKLEQAGLVKYPELFKLYAKMTGSDEEIVTGTFELNTNLDYHALTNALSPSSSNRTVTTVLIPEGYNCRQIFELLAQNNVCSVSALEAYAAEGQFADFWFLENLERGDKYCLEGFLFPDTYEFYVNSTPREALGKMLTGFNNRFSDEMKAQIATLNGRLTDMMQAKGCSETYIAEHQFTVRELVIVASMIEEETAGSGESATIASVIYNRLTCKNEYERYLNIDASIYYALAGNIDPETGKSKPLTSEDLKIDSPFNTYTNAGLTPTPISNPGLASLQAALDPADSQYYYYVLNPETNLHDFSKTLEEHEAKVEKYRGTN